MRIRLPSLIVLALLTAFTSDPVRASDTVRSDHLTARLVAAQSVVKPGDTVTLALNQKLAPHWHTYWRNPGDSGQPPTLDWTLPEGVNAGDWRWPVPERIEVGPLVNYGYSDEVSLLTDVSVPADWPEGEPFPIAATAEILVCEKICIPVDGAFAIEVPTGPETRLDDAARGLFAEAEGRIPPVSLWTAETFVGNDTLSLSVNADRPVFATVTDAYFFADTWGQIDHARPQRLSIDGGRLTLTLPKGQTPVTDGLSGILKIDDGGAMLAYRIATAPLSDTPPPVDAFPAAESYALPILLAFALVGGLLLNLMPCVFPVLAIKALGLARHADADARERGIHGLSYSAGVVLSFTALAALLLVARAAGEAVGWGFQLQNPLVVGALAYVAAAVGLNLSGVFEIGGRLAGAGHGWASRSGHVGSFATGVLAAVVAAPCTAPFMAAAAGGALLLPAPQALSIFAVMGLGLALPYLLLALSPGLARRMPKPGAWMDTFKKALAFPMYATAAWLIWVLAQQTGPDAAFAATLGLIALAAALWLWPHASPIAGDLKEKARAAAFAVMAVTSAGLLAAGTLGVGGTPVQSAVSAEAEPFSMARLEALRAEGRPVFVNMTAAWCITCKVNERVALSGPDFVTTLNRYRVAYLQGDWTNRDPEITAMLERFGRAGVPLYVLFPADGGQPAVLPQLLGPGALRRALENAA